MANRVDLDINSLVYTYLLKTCPKSATTFAKAAKLKPPSANVVVTLELVINSSTAKVNPSKRLTKGLDKSNKDSSNSDSEFSDSEKKQTTKTPAKTSLSTAKVPQKVLPKQKYSSSESSESEDGKKLVQTKPSPLNIKPQTKVACKAPAKKDSSSDSSDSEGEAPSKVKLATPVQKPALSKTPLKMTKKESSSGSSDSEDDASQKKPFIKQIVKITPKVAHKKSSSDSSDSEDDGPKKIPPQKPVVKPAGKTSKESSSESSDDNEDPKKKVQLNISTQKPFNKYNVLPPKAIAAASESSDSEDEAFPIQKGEVAPIKSVAKSVIKAKPASSGSSDSKGDSSSENEVKSKLSAVVPANAKKSAVAAIQQKVPPKANASSSDSSDSEDDAPKGKAAPITPNWAAAAVGKYAAMVDSSSSESEDGKNIVSLAKKISTPPANASKITSKQANIGIIPINNPATKKAAESSSDSDSESESEKAKPAQIQVAKSPKTPLTKKLKAAGSSDSSMDFENDKPSKSIIKQPTQSPKTLQTKKRGREDEESTPVPSNCTKRRRGSSPFRRIKDENYQIDERMQQSSQIAKHNIPNMGAARGKRFRQEKTKKKKGNHFGKIDSSSINSILFD